MREDWPIDLRKEIVGYAAAPNNDGYSSAQVYHLTHPTHPPLYLKISSQIDLHPVRDDYLRLLWLKDKLPVPHVIHYSQDKQQSYLLMTAIPGLPLSDITDPTQFPRGIAVLAEGLKMLHGLPLHDCPFEQGNEVMTAQAEHNVTRGWVKEAELSASLADLLPRLHDTCPMYEERVFTHGDYCLPNILICNGELSGFIDVGMAGISDPYRDIALCIRSLSRNYGTEWLPLFLQAFGRETMDEAKISFYQLLDEFF